MLINVVYLAMFWEWTIHYSAHTWNHSSSLVLFRTMVGVQNILNLPGHVCFRYFWGICFYSDVTYVVLR